MAPSQPLPCLVLKYSILIMGGALLGGCSGAQLGGSLGTSLTTGSVTVPATASTAAGSAALSTSAERYSAAAYVPVGNGLELGVDYGILALTQRTAIMAGNATALDPATVADKLSAGLYRPITRTPFPLMLFGAVGHSVIMASLQSGPDWFFEAGLAMRAGNLRASINAIHERGRADDMGATYAATGAAFSIGYFWEMPQ